MTSRKVLCFFVVRASLGEDPTQIVASSFSRLEGEIGPPSFGGSLIMVTHSSVHRNYILWKESTYLRRRGVEGHLGGAVG